MKELENFAANYSAGKANEAIDKAIAQAYADGYRDGYKDREEEIPVDLRDNKTEYVDLGLPSGTLWATDFEKEDSVIVIYPTILYVAKIDNIDMLNQKIKTYISTKESDTDEVDED